MFIIKPIELFSYDTISVIKITKFRLKINNALSTDSKVQKLPKSGKLKQLAA